jgi:hypothetical protein
MLTLISVLVGHRRGRIPDAPGYFTLGRSLQALIWTGIGYTAIAIIALTLPSVNHISAEYSAGAMAIGIIWWLVYLRRRITAKAVGPAETPVSDASVEAVAAVGRPLATATAAASDCVPLSQHIC